MLTLVQVKSRQDYQDIRLGLKGRGGDKETQVQLIRGQIPEDSGKSDRLDSCESMVNNIPRRDLQFLFWDGTIPIHQILMSLTTSLHCCFLTVYTGSPATMCSGRVLIAGTRLLSRTGLMQVT